MPDWRRLVRGALPALPVPPEREAEVVDELAEIAALGVHHLPVSLPDLEDLRRESRSFADLAGFSSVFLAFDGAGGSRAGGARGELGPGAAGGVRRSGRHLAL